MPQIVEAEAGHPGLATGTVECLADRVAAHRTAIPADERPVWPGPGDHVLSQHGQDMRRDGDGAFACVSLGVSIERGGSGKQFDSVAAHSHRPGNQIHIGGMQAEDLASTQSAPGGKQHGSAVAG